MMDGIGKPWWYSRRVLCLMASSVICLALLAEPVRAQTRSVWFGRKPPSADAANSDGGAAKAPNGFAASVRQLMDKARQQAAAGQWDAAVQSALRARKIAEASSAMLDPSADFSPAAADQLLKELVARREAMSAPVNPGFAGNAVAVRSAAAQPLSPPRDSVAAPTTIATNLDAEAEEQPLPRPRTAARAPMLRPIVARPVPTSAAVAPPIATVSVPVIEAAAHKPEPPSEPAVASAPFATLALNIEGVDPPPSPTVHSAPEASASVASKAVARESFLWSPAAKPTAAAPESPASTADSATEWSMPEFSIVGGQPADATPEAAVSTSAGKPSAWRRPISPFDSASDPESASEPFAAISTVAGLSGNNIVAAAAGFVEAGPTELSLSDGQEFSIEAPTLAEKADSPEPPASAAALKDVQAGEASVTPVIQGTAQHPVSTGVEWRGNGAVVTKSRVPRMIADGWSGSAASSSAESSTAGSSSAVRTADNRTQESAQTPPSPAVMPAGFSELARYRRHRQAAPLKVEEALPTESPSALSAPVTFDEPQADDIALRSPSAYTREADVSAPPPPAGNVSLTGVLEAWGCSKDDMFTVMLTGGVGLFAVGLLIISYATARPR